MLASVAVPCFGQILSYVGPEQYTKFLTLAMGFVGGAHVIFFILLKDLDSKGHLINPWAIFPPIIMITFGHVIFSTIQVPLVDKYMTS